MISFWGRLPTAALAAAILATQLLGVDCKKTLDEVPACDNLFAEVANQTDLDVYKTCKTIGGTMFYIMPEFKGPFDAPGIESVPKLVAGFYGPKIGDEEREENFVTSISMPDLRNTSDNNGVSLGYLEHLTNLSLPRLEFISGGLAVAGTPGLRNLSLPALTMTTGGIYLDGDFDQIDLPALKSAGYIKIETMGNMSCKTIEKAFASVNYTGGKDGFYSGFNCWAFNDVYNQSSSKSGHSGSKESAASSLLDGAWLPVVILLGLFSI